LARVLLKTKPFEICVVLPMLNGPKDTHHSQIVLYNDDQTPWQFVVDLLQSVFGKTETEARAFATKIETQGEAICGSYPPKVAEALLQAAQDRIEADRHSRSLLAIR